MDRTFKDRLTATAGHILFDEPLNRHTSLGVGGRADALVFPKSVEELGRLVGCLNEYACPFMVVGNCTNLLVRDGGYRGVVIAMKNLSGISFMRKDDNYEMLHAQAGATLAELVSQAVDRGLAGMAFCAGIPGSVGGAVIMNAGAYGSEMKDVLYKTRLMDGHAVLTDKLREELAFSYRNLCLPVGTIVVGASFLLKRGDRLMIRKSIDEILDKRAKKHPLDYPSAGSVFKNPPGHPAGYLIEAAGLKGMKIGGAMISEKHGNFIVNIGGAVAADVLSLIKHVQQEVQKQTGIVLEAEVRIVGDP